MAEALTGAGHFADCHRGRDPAQLNLAASEKSVLIFDQLSF
jgi:hypothetical protein